MQGDVQSGTRAPERLRPEAQPTARDRLDDDQRIGFDRIVGLLGAAVDAVPRPADPADRRPVPFLEPNRSSRTILLDGGRGTGKTTLLLTLIDALVHDRAIAAQRSEWSGDVQQLRSRLVWLESLDMEPLDPSTNLLGALLARLEDAVGREVLDRAPDATGPVGLLTPGAAAHDVLGSALVELQTRAVITFEGNLRDRAGGLDPDSFAVESRRAERMRLGLPAAFADVVGRLADSVRKARHLDRSPVFVLPVDDLDLNPISCVPLIELVRAVQSPHLVVLMLADRRIVRTAVRLKYERQFVEAGGRNQLSEECEEQADELTANALRKHLPPEQHIRLAPVDPRRALALVPLDMDGGRCLKDLLGPLLLAVDRVSVPEADDAAAPAPDRSLENAFADLGTDPTRRLTSWAEFFRLPLREIVDMHIEASRRSDLTELIQELAERRLNRSFDALYNAPENLSVVPKLRWTPSERSGPTIETATILRWTLSYQIDGLDRRDLAALVGALDLRDVRAQHAEQYLVAPTSLRRTVASAHPAWPIDWPMPQHSTTWGVERAADRVAATDLQWPTDDPDRLFGSWIATMTAILREAFAWPDGDAPGLPTPSWEGVRDQLNALGDRPAAIRWRAEVLALCSPEMGMTEDRATDVWRARRTARDRAAREQAVRIRAARSLPEELGAVRGRWQPPGSNPS